MNDKSEEIFGLLKVPDAEIIKQLRLEIGLLTSERDEALFELSEANKDPVIHKHSENSEYIFSLEGQVKNLKLNIHSLKTGDYIVKLKEHIERLEGFDVSNRKLIGVLQKELFKHAKEHIG